MTDYEIKTRQKDRAKLMGLTIKPSTNKKKKIDVKSSTIKEQLMLR